MSIKRLVLCIALLSLGLLLATSVQAKQWPLAPGGGGQLHIGNGLALPIQPSLTYLTGPNDFPPLLVKPVQGAIISGTTGNPLLTGGGKSAYQNKLTIPAGVLSKAAGQTTIGLRFSNPTLFAVGTNVKYTWPAAPATFSQAAAAASPAVITFPITGTVIASLTYSNSLPSRFGGPAQFMLSPGAANGLIAAPITIYAKINATTPACTHNAFGGTDAACVAGLFRALPTGLQAAGARALTISGGPNTITTPGGPVPAPNVAVLKMGLTPLGTISLAVAAAAATLPDNKATSQGGPWTTGRVVIKNGAAAGAAETFTLSGKDSRTSGGKGTIQLVSGTVSNRAQTGPNANRAWVELQLGPFPGDVPAMSPSLLAAAGGLLLIAGGYVARRRMTS
jgi:hypothetical protein